MEHLEKLLILPLEDLIPDHYFVVLSFQLFNFSLKISFLYFPSSLPRARHKGGVVLRVVASFAPYVEKGYLIE